MAGQVDSAASAASLSFFLERQASNTVRALVGVGAGNVAIQSVTTYTGTTNPGWHHFAVTREGTALRLFIDGVHVATQTLAGTVNNSAAALSVGRAGEITSATWLGSIDEFRILVGRAAWTEGFIPEAFEYDQWDWELLGDEQLPADNQPIIWRFAEETLMAVRLRMTPSYEPPEIAVMYTDVLLELERRIYVGHRVLQYNRRANIVTGFSDEATFLGRIVLGELNESSLDLKNITPQFFRTDMEPWLRNSTERPFFFAWRPTSYPAEVGFCWLTGDPQMSNMRPNGMVQMSASLRGVS
jgi:hypothetical protein